MKKLHFGGLAVWALLSVVASPAHAAAIWVSGTTGFSAVGQINQLGGCPAGCDSGLVLFAGLGANNTLNDGLSISGLFEQFVLDNGANTTAAFMRVSALTATNLGNAPINDTFYFATDQFALPTLAGPAGVGIIGAYTGTGGNITAALTQAQMNYLTTGFLTAGAIGNPINGFSLTTPFTFVQNCVGCGVVPFWEANFQPVAPGGVEELVGAINFQLAPGDTVLLPGSVIVESNDDAQINAELPEPGTVVLSLSALAGLAFLRRRRMA